MARFRKKPPPPVEPTKPLTADDVLVRQCRDALQLLIGRLKDANDAGLDVSLDIIYSEATFGIDYKVGRVPLERLRIRAMRSL